MAPKAKFSVKVKDPKIIAAIVVAVLCICSSCLWAFSGTFKAATSTLVPTLAPARPTPPATQAASAGLPKGTKSKVCWPDQIVDAACPSGCRNNKKDDKKCGGARTSVWDGSAWRSCKWNGGDSFDCTKTCTTASIC